MFTALQGIELKQFINTCPDKKLAVHLRKKYFPSKNESLIKYITKDIHRSSNYLLYGKY